MPRARNSGETPLRNDFVPYYYQIAGILERKIEHGEYKPGSKLPGELPLSKTFQVSRISVRRALSLLVDKGLLVRQRGSGTYVSRDIKISNSIVLTGVSPDYRIWEALGELRLLSIYPTPAPRKYANFLRTPPRESLVRIDRLRLVGNTPYTYISHFLPEKTFQKMLKEDLEKLPIVVIFEKRIGNPVSYIHQTLEARIADREVARHLRLNSHSPVMFVETYMSDEKGRPLGISQRQFRADRFQYTMELKRSREVGQAGSFVVQASFPGSRHNESLEM